MGPVLQTDGMTTESTGAHFDAGKPLYIVVDQNGQALSYHESEHGAESQLGSRSDATAIRLAELHH